MGFRFETVWQDLHFALRQLRRSLGFTLTAILMLALGVGASVAIFAFVDAALIKPLPYKDPTRLVDVNERAKMFPRSNLSYPDYLDWKKINNVFSALEAYGGGGYLISTPSGVERVQAAGVSAGFFRVLGALAEMTSIAKHLEVQYPGTNRGQGASVKPLSEQIVGDIRPILLVLLGGAGLLLVIACVNVSSLLLVRSEARKREIAVRGALGASPSRLGRQFMTESLVLGLVGGVLGGFVGGVA